MNDENIGGKENNKEMNNKKESNENENKTEQKEQEKKEETVSKEEYMKLKDSFLRLAAEFDNYKKRTKAEEEYAKKKGIAEVFQELFPILDEFELAIDALSAAPKDNGLSKGVEMLYSNMKEALKRLGLVEIDATGVYDPYKHEIVMTKESDKKPGTILEVVKKGYMLENTVLRPCSVIVAKETEKS
ncbi:MAG: nucleotide exchange factor GrpE [Candidatus Micrarchaeia archaeon]